MIGITPWHALDDLRRWAGLGLDAAGLAPRQTPSTDVLNEPGLRLRRYPVNGAGGAALLLVPAPIKRHYIWDLHPGCSVVAHAQRRGLDVWLSEWTEASPEDGLDRYVSHLARCVDTIEAATGRVPHLAGHSLGGTLAALHATRHPDRLRALVLLEAPLHFAQDAGAFAPLLQATPSATPMAAALGRVPGSVLNAASVLASPKEFIWQRRAAGLAAAARGGEALRTYLMALRWSLDEFALPGRLFAEVVDGLYRQDRLMRGELELLGQRVRPADLRAPLATVVDPRADAIPPASGLAFHHAASSADKLVLSYDGDPDVLLQHVGSLTGESAHRRLWPALFDWLARTSAPA